MLHYPRAFMKNVELAMPHIFAHRLYTTHAAICFEGLHRMHYIIYSDVGHSMDFPCRPRALRQQPMRYFLYCYSFHTYFVSLRRRTFTGNFTLPPDKANSHAEQFGNFGLYLLCSRLRDLPLLAATYQVASAHIFISMPTALQKTLAPGMAAAFTAPASHIVSLTSRDDI
jgi:hypothetical protein